MQSTISRLRARKALVLIGSRAATKVPRLIVESQALGLSLAALHILLDIVTSRPQLPTAVPVVIRRVFIE